MWYFCVASNLEKLFQERLTQFEPKLLMCKIFYRPLNADYLYRIVSQLPFENISSDQWFVPWIVEIVVYCIQMFERLRVGLAFSTLACEKAHLWVTRGSAEEQSDPAGQSLVTSQLVFALDCDSRSRCSISWTTRALVLEREPARRLSLPGHCTFCGQSHWSVFLLYFRPTLQFIL